MASETSSIGGGLGFRRRPEIRAQDLVKTFPEEAPEEGPEDSDTSLPSRNERMAKSIFL